ncbi:conjugative transposon protein TraM, partial [Parabacteroides distasonis]
KKREQEALAELEKALAEARLRGQNAVMSADTDTAATVPAQDRVAEGTVSEESRSVKAPSEDEPPSEVVRKVKTTSDYFNTLAKDAREPKLIQAIIDEDIKAVDGSRVRLRLLDDVEINECIVKRGSYLYATVSGFSSGRVKGDISSILVNDELVKVSLTLYDTDGMEGLYVPNSQFRETSKDVASGAMSGNMNMSTGTYGNSLAQWGMQAMNNAYQKTSNAISKAIKKNKVNLKYGTFVYLVNGREKRN